MCESERQPLPQSNRQLLEGRIVEFLSNPDSNSEGYAFGNTRVPTKASLSIFSLTPNSFATRYTYEESTFLAIYNKEIPLDVDATGSINDELVRSQKGLVFHFTPKEKDEAVTVSILLSENQPATMRVLDYNTPTEEESRFYGEENGRVHELADDVLGEVVSIFDILHGQKNEENAEDEVSEHKMLVDSVSILTDYIVHSAQNERGVDDEAIERNIPLEYVRDIVAFSTEGLKGIVWNPTAQIFLGTASDDEGSTFRGIKVNAQGSGKDDGYEIITQMVWTNHPDDEPIVSLFEPKLHAGEVQELAKWYATNEDLRCYKSTLQKMRGSICNGFGGVIYDNNPTESE